MIRCPAAIAGLLLLCRVATAGSTFDVRDYGAAGDGMKKDTAALQKAIDAAAEHGGIVLVPAGRYLSGTIHLRSDVTLSLSPGSVILASPDEADFDAYEKLPFQSVSDKETTYFHYGLVTAENVHDIVDVPGLGDAAYTGGAGHFVVFIKGTAHVTLMIIPGTEEGYGERLIQAAKTAAGRL